MGSLESPATGKEGTSKRWERHTMPVRAKPHQQRHEGDDKGDCERAPEHDAQIDILPRAS